MRLNHHDKSRNQMVCIPLKKVELPSFRCCSIYFIIISLFLYSQAATLETAKTRHIRYLISVIVLISTNVKRHLSFVLSNDHVIHAFSSS